jgi:hypothetical protein
VVAFFEDALHPESKASFLLDTLCRSGRGGHRNSRLAGFRRLPGREKPPFMIEQFNAALKLGSMQVADLR